MTVNSGEDDYAAYRRDRDQEEKLLDRFRDPADPLKILIVTAPGQFQNKPVLPIAPSLGISRSPWAGTDYAACRYGSSRASSAQMIRAFLLATATHAFGVPSFACLSAIHRLRSSVSPFARYTTARAP